MNAFFRVIDQIMHRKVAFLVTFFVVFTLSYGILYAFDFLPEPAPSEVVEPVDEEDVDEAVNTTTNSVVTTPVSIPGGSLPETLGIPSLDRTVTILNPASRSVESLDAALLKGVVRHPDSAALGEDGNLFILGHSSYLPIVHNKNFQALNGIQNLVWGDTITLTSDDTEYTYRVEKVYKAKASALVIPIAGEGKRLTLATCNSFGSTDDRYIVEASLVSTNVLTSL